MKRDFSFTQTRQDLSYTISLWIATPQKVWSATFGLHHQNAKTTQQQVIASLTAQWTSHFLLLLILYLVIYGFLFL